MSHSLHKTILVFLALSALFIAYFFYYSPKPILPVIAIANYGPHASLDATIRGLKEELAHKGLVEGRDFNYEILDANFDHTLIRQMLAKLKAHKPAVLVTLSTPVTQAAKSIKDIPIVFADITSPLEVGLLKEEHKPDANMTGASDRQDLRVFLSFAKKILPHAKRIGLLYSTSDANDMALVKMLQNAAIDFEMQVVLVPIEHANDVKLRMHAFKDKVDFIYVGVSGPIQPTLPTIAAIGASMKIPVFNADENAVKEHQVLGSYGVSYYKVGVNTAQIVFDILQGKQIDELPPRYPLIGDHQGYLSKKVADKYGITLNNLANVTIVE